MLFGAHGRLSQAFKTYLLRNIIRFSLWDSRSAFDYFIRKSMDLLSKVMLFFEIRDPSGSGALCIYYVFCNFLGKTHFLQ